MNFVLGGATSHWVTGSTWPALTVLRAVPQREMSGVTYNYLWHFEVYGNLRDGPHAHSRVQVKTVAVDGSKKTNNGNAVAYGAVVLDLPELGYMIRAIGQTLFEDARHRLVGLPLR